MAKKKIANNLQLIATHLCVSQFWYWHALKSYGIGRVIQKNLYSVDFLKGHEISLTFLVSTF